MRYKTGDVCPATGQYVFDGYVDGTYSPPPTANERVIPLDNGDRFPPVHSCNKAAYWRG